MGGVSAVSGNEKFCPRTNAKVLVVEYISKSENNDKDNKSNNI